MSVAEVEGHHVLCQAPFENRKNGLADGGAPANDVVVPKAQDRIAETLEMLVSALVFQAACMLPAVDLDNQFG